MEQAPKHARYLRSDDTTHIIDVQGRDQDFVSQRGRTNDIAHIYNKSLAQDPNAYERVDQSAQLTIKGRSVTFTSQDRIPYTFPDNDDLETRN